MGNSHTGGLPHVVGSCHTIWGTHIFAYTQRLTYIHIDGLVQDCCNSIALTLIIIIIIIIYSFIKRQTTVFSGAVHKIQYYKIQDIRYKI